MRGENLNRENRDQRALRQWLTAGLQIPAVVSLAGDAGYLLNNMVAKYSLAARNYALSVAASEALLKSGVGLDRTYPRRRFYGRDSPFIYEHAIPAGIVRDALLRSDRSERTVGDILSRSGPVAVLLRDEDARIRAAGLARRMPANWSFGDDPLARYQAVGIQLSSEVLHVTGAIVR